MWLPTNIVSIDRKSQFSNLLKIQGLYPQKQNEASK